MDINCGLLQEWASNDLLAKVLSIMDQASSRQWITQMSDRVYAEPINPDLDPIRGHVLYYVSQPTETTDKGEEVTVKYILVPSLL
jgi:hypothetical protein